MHRVCHLVLACLIAGSLFSSAAAAPAKSVDIVKGPIGTQIDELLTQAAGQGYFGAVIVKVKGEIVLKAGYGFANREAQTPFTPETIAQIGSITKPLTAIAVLQLAEQGKLDLKAQAKTYLTGAREPAASATVHQLLTHTAGLADYCGGDFDKLAVGDLMERCMAMPLAHKPGEYAYSNMGFSILAAIIEKVSGKTWEGYLRSQIFAPLGMTRTGFTFPASAPTQFATGYLDNKPQAVISDRLATLGGADWNLRGNGGIQAAASDMHRLYRGLVGRSPGISRSIFDLMTKPHERIDGEAWEGYGIAVRLDETGKPHRIGHAGSDGTFFSYFGWYPQHDAFIYFVGSNGEPAVKPVLVQTLRALQNGIGVKPPAPKLSAPSAPR